MTAPLHGLKIVDLTTVVLGPFATQILGDLGAEIIKVESPEGDANRYLSPGRNTGMGGIAMTLHRNKRSIVLDLKNPAARAVLVKLVSTADAFVHNIRPAAMQRLKLSWDDLKTINPRLVYCIASGFGSEGPYSNRPAYDDLIQGASGISSLIKRSNGQPGFFPGVICDKVTGLTVVYALLGALLFRERTGLGQLVEVPMLETMVAFNLVEHVGDSVFHPQEGSVGYERLLTTNRKPYRTLDGHICVLPYSSRNWLDFFSISGRAHLADDPRFRDLPARTKYIAPLYEILEQALLEKTTAEWEALCASHQIPCMRLVDVADLHEDPHLNAVQFFKHADHPSQGAYRQVDIPTRFSESPASVRRHAPVIGEHSIEILEETGHSRAEIERLLLTGATVDGQRSQAISSASAAVKN